MEQYHKDVEEYKLKHRDTMIPEDSTSNQKGMNLFEGSTE